MDRELRDTARFIHLLARTHAGRDPLIAMVVGVPDSEPCRRIGLAVTGDQLLWIDADNATVISISRDAIGHIAFHHFDAAPHPICFEVEIDATAGEVVLMDPSPADRRVPYSARAVVAHQFIDAVRLTETEANRLACALGAIPAPA